MKSILNLIKSVFVRKEAEKTPEIKPDVTPEPRRRGPLHAYRMDK